MEPSSLPLTRSSSGIVAAEDHAIASIGRRISVLPSSTTNSSQHAHPRDSYESAPRQYYSHRKAKQTSSVDGTSRSKSKPTNQRHSKASSSSSQHKPRERAPSIQQEPVQFAEHHNYSEPNDGELESLLGELNRNLTNPNVLASDPPSDSTTMHPQETFLWLVGLVIDRLEPLGALSSCRHQFALFIIALYRRNEHLELYSSVSSVFQTLWNEKTITAALNLLVKTISTPYSPNDYPTHIDSLRALSLILFENSHLFSGLYHSILACLKPICDVRIVLDKEAQRIAFNCLGNMCYKSGNHGQSHYEEIWALLTRQMAQLQPQVMTQANLCRVFASVLRAIQFIIPEAKTLHEHGLPSLIASLHKFLFYGTPIGGSFATANLSGNPSTIRIDTELGKITTSVVPITSGLSTGHLVAAGDTDDQRSMELGDDDDPHASGGTSYSGSDVYNDKHGLWKVRYHVLGCLQAVARQSGPKFTQFWNLLLPQSPHQPSLVTTVLLDPVHQVRGAACRLLSAIFDGQRSFLDASQARLPQHSSPTRQQNVSVASDVSARSQFPGDSSVSSSSSTLVTPTKSRIKSPSPSSFIPLSLKLTNMLREVHTGLYQALTTETRSTTLVLIIKTAGVLAQETPYDSLPTGTVSKFMLHLQKLSLDKTLDHRLMKVSISSLTSFIGARVTTQEVFDALDPTSSTVLEQMDKILETETTWSIKTEVFRFFSSLALHFPRLMIAHWKSVFSIILNTITGESAQENDPNTRHAAAKVVDDFSKALLHLSSSPSQSPLDQFTSELWQGILNSRLSELMVKDRFANVRSAICNLFSQVPAPVFATLSRKHQVMCITLQLGAIKDEVPAVRSQAARALGIYILNHALKVDPLFVSDVALALVEAMKDKNLNVRTKAAWSAANLCDALVSVRESSVSGSYSVDDDGELENRNGLEDTQGVSPSDDVPRETLIQLAKTVLSACRDNDKVRCNAIRAVGNFMRFSNKNTFSESKYEEGQLAPPLVKQLIETLLHYTHEGSAKVRWNACYALANLFHNPYIVNTFQWATERAIDALLAVLKTSSNFKVRINAATALLIAIASSSALPMSPTLIESILKVVTPLAAEGTLTELESPEGLDSRYNESLRDNLRRLIVTCLAHMSSSAPNTLTSGQILLVASHLSTFREAINLTSSLSDASSSSKSDPNSHEMGEDGSGNMEDHTQLKPPSAKEMKSLADRALDLVNRVASLP